MQVVYVAREGVDDPHGVQVGEGALATAESARQQLDDALKVERCTTWRSALRL